jgi:hypothetical protein
MFDLNFLFPTVILLTGIILYSLYVKYIVKYHPKYPPYSPTSLYFNLMMEDGYCRLQHFFKESLWCTKHAPQNGNISGCVYRLALPLPGGLFICCDYKLARLLLNGNDMIQESDKSFEIRVLNLFPDVFNILT